MSCDASIAENIFDSIRHYICDPFPSSNFYNATHVPRQYRAMPIHTTEFPESYNVNTATSIPTTSQMSCPTTTEQPTSLQDHCKFTLYIYKFNSQQFVLYI